MCPVLREAVEPRGGLQAGAGGLRGWKWSARGRLISQPVRCRRDEWYLARARLTQGSGVEQAALLVIFLRDGHVLSQRCLRLHALAEGGCPDQLLGWIKTPDKATHLRLCVPDRTSVSAVQEIVLRDVSERDPKCHPLANVPRWSVHRPPFPIRRVLLPDSLCELAGLVDWCDVRVLKSPPSLATLAKQARGAACVLDPRWPTANGLTLADLERMAATSWLITDLDTTARVLSEARAAETEVRAHVSADGIMSARVEYSDVPTRGLALQDVVPYATIDPRGRFRTRVLRANPSWKRYADEVGFATMLGSETPWARHHNDVLSAARAVGGGEWIATDLPWLVAGQQGPQLAPRIARHLLRMHLGAPLEDHLQYWNRWDDAYVVVRDLADLARRYPPLRPLRWPSSQPDVARLGIVLAMSDKPAARHTMFRTGRIDNVDVHDGLPPEPMAIFMKWLAREAREQTEWARRYLADRVVTWQFDTADGLKYAVNFDPTGPLAEPVAQASSLCLHRQDAGATLTVVSVRLGDRAAEQGNVAADTGEEIILTQDEGLYGDGSLGFQDVLTRRLRQLIERLPPVPVDATKRRYC